MDRGGFEWDEAKAQSNAAKHGVTFDLAKLAFQDAFALEWSDVARAEPRISCLAMAEGRLLFVAYTMRDDTVRLISARLATAAERRRYHDEQQS